MDKLAKIVGAVIARTREALTLWSRITMYSARFGVTVLRRKTPSGRFLIPTMFPLLNR